MAIIDVHCHILPGVDDGAKDIETSLAMLEASRDQGVQCMVATPHFYATRDRVDAFLTRRKAAWEALKARMEPSYTGSAAAAIHCGATVKFVDIQKDGDPEAHCPEMDYDALEAEIMRRLKLSFLWILVELSVTMTESMRLWRRREAYSSRWRAMVRR